MELIEWFKTITTAHVDKLIEDHQEEHLQLDFKTITRTNLSYRDDRRNLASCISGFANSSGGLVIWGVKARPDDRDVDCAVEPSLISPLSEFLSRLNEYTGQAASPIVDGVLHKALEKTASEGYAVTLVPESHSGPHMAKLGEDRYYKRSGGSFRKMEHFDLEDMFGRRQKPNLSVAYELEEGPQWEAIKLRLVNSGRAIAKHCGLFVRMENVKIVGTTPGLENVSHLNVGRPSANFADDHGVIHPNGISRHVGDIRFQRID